MMNKGIRSTVYAGLLLLPVLFCAGCTPPEEETNFVGMTRPDLVKQHLSIPDTKNEICEFLFDAAVRGEERKVDIDDFCAFKSAMVQLSLLRGKGRVVSESAADIESTIRDWKKDDLRKKALTLLADNGINIQESNKGIAIEWGGGGVPYSAMFFLDAVWLIRDHGAGDLSIKKISETKDAMEDVHPLIRTITETKYEGDITGDGEDIPTYIITLFHDKSNQTVILYEAAVPEIGEENGGDPRKDLTVKILERIMKIKEKCNIKPDSGA